MNEQKLTKQFSEKGIKMNPNLLQEIIRKFDVTEDFIQEYYRLYPNFAWNAENLDTLLETLSPLDKMHFAFTLSTTIRGRYAFELLDMNQCIRNKNRYLDIGTAYAGFLRAFKEQRFQEVIGVEIKEYLARLGKANICDLDNAKIIVGDFVNSDFSHLGLFDVITCNDVIEHVDNPVVALTKISNLLAQEGCLALEVPNKDFIGFVTSDGHFQIFGIAQLGRDDASEYYSAVLGQTTKNYLFEMGEMYELSWYIDQLTRNGLKAYIADTHKVGSVEDAPALIAELKKAYTEWNLTKRPQLDEAISAKVSMAVDAYIQELEDDLALATNPIARQRFEDKYMRSFWTIFATKSPTYRQYKEDSKNGSSQNAQIAYLHQEIAQIKNSTLWKATRPLRFIMKLIHNPRKAIKELWNYLGTRFTRK